MELDITDLGRTLVVGAFILYGADLISGSILGRNVTGWLRDSPLISDRGTIAIAVALCFALGMAAETLSDAVVDRRGGLYGLLDWWPGVERDDEIKADVLFGKRRGDPQLVQAPLDPTLRDSLGSLYFAQFGDVGRDAATREGAIAAAKSYYYYAKNAVFREPNYFNELTRIQIRIDFIRSLWLVTLGLFGLLIVLIPVRLAVKKRWIERGWARMMRLDGDREPVDFRVAGADPGASANGTGGGLVLRTIGTAGALLFCSHLSMVGFRREEREFDMRVFGYYRTIQGGKIDTQLNVEIARILNIHRSKHSPPEPGVAAAARVVE